MKRTKEKVSIESSMECGAGWRKIVDDATRNIYVAMDMHGVRHSLFKVDQIKAKFGTLRYYYHIKSDDVPRELYEKIDGIIRTAERQSAETCENCGEKAHPRRKHTGWIYTLCDVCRDSK